MILCFELSVKRDRSVLVSITGASGRIGGNVVAALVARGHQVRALVLPGDPRTGWLEGLGVELIEGTVEDPVPLARFVDGCDAVCHLAAALVSDETTDLQLLDVNVRGTYQLLAASVDHSARLQRFLYVSSDAVYWTDPTTESAYLPVDEAHPLVPGDVYGFSKLAGEQLCHMFMRRHGLPCTLARLSMTANPKELVDPTSAFGRRWFDANGRIRLEVDRKGSAPLIDLNDARNTAEGLILMLLHPEAVGETFNLGPPAPVSLRLFLEYLAEQLGTQLTVAPSAKRMPSWFLSSAKARSVIGYRPIRTAFAMVDEALRDLERPRS